MEMLKLGLVRKQSVNYHICISNSMVSSAIWEKHAQVSFSKTIKMDQCNLSVV